MLNLTNPTDKEKAIYFLKCLLELIENDRVHASAIAGKTSEEIIAMAEVEAQKAVEGSEALKG